MTSILPSTPTANISIVSVNIQDRRKPYWLEVTYIVKHSSAKKRWLKKFTKQKEGRKNINLYVKELDDFNFVANDENARPQENFQVDSDSSSDTLNKRMKLEKLPKNSALLSVPVNPAIIISSQTVNVDFETDISEPLNPPDGYDGCFFNRMSASDFAETCGGVAEKLFFALQSGNFFEVWSGPSLPMVDISARSGNRISNVTDFSRSQQAKMYRDCNLLFHYYNFLHAAALSGHLKLGVKTAAINTSLNKCVVKVSVRQMYRLIKEFEEHDCTLVEDLQGRHERRWIVKHKLTWGRMARDFVRKHSIKKGEPNMSVASFQQFVNTTILSSVKQSDDKKGLSNKILNEGIAESTARMWLHYMGCFFRARRKDVFYDGHERPDNVQYRQQYVPRYLNYMNDPDIIVLNQDESVYKSNEFETMHWDCPEDEETGETGVTFLSQKGGGYGTMISGFTAVEGFLSLTDTQLNSVNAKRSRENKAPLEFVHRVSNQEVAGLLGAPTALTFSYCFFEYGKNRGGYWNSEKMLKQTDEVIDMLEEKYPGKRGAILVDWSSNHDKLPEDALVLSRMSVKWGGKQPNMRPTVVLEEFAAPARGLKALTPGDTQHLIFQPGDPPPFYEKNAKNYVGTAKGLKQVAWERGLWRAGMVGYDEEATDRSLYHVLLECMDFQQQAQSLLQELIEGRGHISDFLPKFHCELAAIERIWSKSKKFTTSHSDQTRPTLLKNIPLSFLPPNLTQENVSNYFRKTVEYAQRYHAGDSLLLAKMSIKKKSHRTVPKSEANL